MCYHVNMWNYDVGVECESGGVVSCVESEA